MKTLISIPGCAASGVLKSLKTNNVDCNYMGLDQSGRIVMEVTYNSEQAVLIKELNEYMQTWEELVGAFKYAINEAIEKYKA